MAQPLGVGPPTRARKRIVLYGHTGAGKSVLASRLGAMLHLPIVHIDRLSFGTAWTRRPEEEVRALVDAATRGEAWIMDGVHGAAMSLLMTRAELVVFLDTPRWLCSVRIFRRWLSNRGRSRPDIGEGCVDRLSWRLVAGTFFYPRPLLLRNLALISPGTPVITLRRPGEVAQFLERVREEAAPWV